jgi:hypothetical protein
VAALSATTLPLTEQHLYAGLAAANSSLLRMNLFTYRDLNAWLDNPFGTPPILPASPQLTLGLA